VFLLNQFTQPFATPSFFTLLLSHCALSFLIFAMPPSAALPKSLRGPPARDPPPTWMIPASRHSPPNANIHYRGFSGEFEFSVPNDDVSAIAHRIIQGEQALQMYHCQIQSFQCQLGLLQAQAQLHQLQLMSQRVHNTDIQQSALPDWGSVGTSESG
jgi:hypothetical protein